jgi:hypothetical protein
MMTRRALVASAVLTFLTSCAATYDVAKMGPDTYSVSAQASPARGGASGSRSMALNKATDYCQGMGREMLVKNISGHTTNIYGAGGVDVTFQCLVAGDPELRRPDYQRPPDVVIQDRRG